MKYLLIPTLMMLLLQKYVKSEEQCGERSITGAVGGAVTLPVGRTEVKSFVWSFVGKDGSIATTSGGSTSILQEQYEGRLSSTSDGSLIINELKQEDQGTYLAQISRQKCFYHLTVFSNLTAEDVTISSNVTVNETCVVILTCSANGSDVTVTWKNLNSSDINQTENVVFVSSRNVNFTYICTAKNPVSEVSKTVHPWRYCQKEKTDVRQSEQRTVFGFAAVSFVVFIIIVVFFVWRHHRKRKKCENLNEERAALKQIANTYEMRDEDCTGNNEALGDEHAGSQTPNVKQPIPSRVKGTAGMSKNPQTMELQESQSNETTDKSLYSTVLHVKEPQESQSNFTTSNTLYSTVSQPKQKNNQTKQPGPSKGNLSNAPMKPTRQMLESPMDKNEQKSSSERPNGNCSNSPLESCYAEVQLPKDKSYQQAPLESCYAEVQLPKPTEL
ncbi:SLAM family member 5-like isoform X2 [Rana temporaria]|uniref:SLAM family member 5-like isoform X2 n=1 Tax=Rana temporaria TaxID=8407 RepID=UPI001AACDBF9|nr:SLAM family member 5-like isoform X2 [Rana temporaria]